MLLLGQVPPFFHLPFAFEGLGSQGNMCTSFLRPGFHPDIHAEWRSTEGLSQQIASREPQKLVESKVRLHQWSASAAVAYLPSLVGPFPKMQLRPLYPAQRSPHLSTVARQLTFEQHEESRAA